MPNLRAVSSASTSLPLAAALVLLTAGSAFATPDPPDQTATSAAPTSATAAAQQDDAAVLQPAEPDYRLINLPTTLRLPLFKGNFDLTHRFNGNLRRGSFSSQASRFFGIDDGATVGFEYRVAVARHLEAVVYRVAFQQTVQFYAKYDAVHQPQAPVSVSVLASVEGISNFHKQHAPALGASLSRAVGDVAAFYAVPTWVNNSAAGTGVDRHTFYMGLGGRLRVRPTVYVAAEVSPRLSGYAPGKPEFGVALEKRAGGHMFQLNVANTSASTFAQIARGGAPKSLYLGFNLSRKFF